MDKSQIARVFEFDLKIRGGWFPSRASFATECGVCERTVARDIEYIRERLKAPLAYDKRRRGYYYSKPWNLPPLLMATYTTEEKEDFAVKFLMNLDEETRKQIIDTVVDLTKFDHPPCHSENAPLPNGQILPGNDMAAN